jgi:hypothetical protein
MMNFINAIPENIGWVMVGAAWAFALVLTSVVVRQVAQIIKDNREEEKEAEVVA